MPIKVINKDIAMNNIDVKNIPDEIRKTIFENYMSLTPDSISLSSDINVI